MLLKIEKRNLNLDKNEEKIWVQTRTNNEVSYTKLYYVNYVVSRQAVVGGSLKLLGFNQQFTANTNNVGAPRQWRCAWPMYEHAFTRRRSPGHTKNTSFEAVAQLYTVAKISP